MHSGCRVAQALELRHVHLELSPMCNSLLFRVSGLAKVVRYFGLPPLVHPGLPPAGKPGKKAPPKLKVLAPAVPPKRATEGCHGRHPRDLSQL